MSTAWKRKGYKQLPNASSRVTRRDAEYRKQERLGYSVEIMNRGEEMKYQEGTNYLIADISHSNPYRLSLRSLIEWQEPINKKLTEDEYFRVLQRICDFLMCEGSPLILVDEYNPVLVAGLPVVKSIAPRIKGWKHVEMRSNIILKAEDIKDA